MKLYDMVNAPNPRRVRIFLAEKGIEIERQEVDIRAGENLQPEYLAVNPRGVLPALRLADGRVLDESIAICRFFEALHPEPNLFGRDAFEQAEIEQWQRRTEFDGMFSIGMAFRNSLPAFANHSTAGAMAPETTQIPALVERGLMLSRLWLDALEKRLEGREWIASDRFTIADITAFVALDFAKWIKLRADEAHPNVQAYHARIRARPSATA